MKKHSPIMYVLVVAIIFAIAGLIAMNIRAARAQRPQTQDGGKDEQVMEREALRRGGYREAAKVKGHYIGTFDPNWDWSLFDIEALTKQSAVVVVGTPTRSSSQLSSNGLLVTTQYEVAVQEVIKGKLIQGDTIKVSLPGGKVEFEDGTSAEVNTPDFERMENNGLYVLFLSANRNGSDALILTGGPQGLFELPPNSTSVKPHGRLTDPAVKEVKDKNSQSFLEEVRTQAQKWPEPGACCR